MKIVWFYRIPESQHPQVSSDHTGKTTALESHLDSDNKHNCVCEWMWVCVQMSVWASVCVCASCVCVYENWELKQIQNGNSEAP